MRWVLLFLRIAVPSGAAFGLITELIQHDAHDGLVQGAVFGGLVALVLTASTAARTRGRAPTVSVRSRMQAHLPVPPADALDLVVASLARLGARSIVRTADRVSAHTGRGWFSWGERIDVVVRPDQDLMMAMITSRPRVRTTMADYGRNRDNVEHLILLLGGIPVTPDR